MKKPRLWSIHPKLMDTHTLIETYTSMKPWATAASIGRTNTKLHAPIGFSRVSKLDDYPGVIGLYCRTLAEEMVSRDVRKVRPAVLTIGSPGRVLLRRGQLEREWDLLRLDIGRFNRRWAPPWGMMYRLPAEPNPIFTLIDGPIEPWEPTMNDDDIIDEIYRMKLSEREFDR